MQTLYEFLVNNHVKQDTIFYDDDIHNIPNNKWVIFGYEGKPRFICYITATSEKQSSVSNDATKLGFTAKYYVRLLMGDDEDKVLDRGRIFANVTDGIYLDKEWDLLEWTPEYKNVVYDILKGVKGKDYGKDRIQIGTIDDKLNVKIL